MSKKILVWFRNDLRLHDNEMLVEAIAKSDSILPVYFFDPRYFIDTQFKTAKTGNTRARFILESVDSLRKAFQEKGGDLLLIQGQPEDHFSELVSRFEIAEVYHHREVSVEETAVSTSVEDVLWKQRINLKHFIGHTLYNKEDLPFPIKDIPDVFAQFKKKTERDASVKACLERPERISFVENDDWGVLPELSDLGFEEESSFENVSNGGEDKGVEHLNTLLSAASDIYKKPVKNNLDKEGFSSKLSAWLAIGCLSPRMVYWSVKEAEALHGSHPNFNQLILGLLWRDYYRFMFKKHGFKFFKEDGLEHMISEPINLDEKQMQEWKDGATGHPLVDRYMQQLNSSGFISHAARLTVATFLVHTLNIHWTKGAAYFEEKLIDHSPASNWGNWATVAGVALELKSKNTFDLEKQMKILDVAVTTTF